MDKDCKCQDYKAKVNEVLLAEWKTMTESILSYAQVASGENWFPLRSKILRISNDFIRRLRDRLDLDLTTEGKQD